MEKIPDEKYDEILNFSFSLFQKQGVSKQAIFPFYENAVPTDTYNVIRNKILLWSNKLDEIRTDAIKAQVLKNNVLLKEIYSSSSTIIKDTNSSESLKETLEDLVKTMQVVKDYIEASSNEIVSLIDRKFEMSWSAWCDQMTGTNQEKAEFISKHVDQWIKIEFKAELKNVLNHNLNKMSEILPSTSEMIGATEKYTYINDIQPNVYIQTEIIDAEEKKTKSQKNIINFTISIAVAGIGLLIGKPVWGISGAVAFAFGGEKIINSFPKLQHNDLSFFEKWLENASLQIKKENEKVCRMIIDSIVDDFQKITGKNSMELKLKIAEAESTGELREDALIKYQQSSGLLDILQELDA